MFIRDAAAATSREVTPEGFLRVRARIGRAGLHGYRAAELGNPAGFAPDDTVQVYRPPEEVFDPASMASFRSKPVTDDHPPQMIDAGNWKRYAVGQCGDEVTRDGDHLATDLLISDASGASRALAGAELSNGYFADFIFVKGETPEGEPYDAVQRNIRGNHVALVDAGRCGSSCRVGDAAPASCGCSSSDHDGEVLTRLRQRLTEVEGEHARALAAKDGEIAALSARIPDAVALDALVVERATVIDTARRTLGPAFDPAGRSAADIRRLVVSHTLGPERVTREHDAYVLAAFDALAVTRVAVNPLARYLAAGSGRPPSRDAALAARNRYLTDAWKRDDASGQQGDP